MGRKLAFALLLLIVGLIVAAIALRREPPQVRRDEDHLRTWGDWPACLDCHGSDRANPRPRSHPAGEICSQCHSLRREDVPR